MKQPRVAVIHYWFVTWRGGEKVVESILKLFPQADVYTLFYDPNVCGSYLKGHKVFTSSIDLPILRDRHQQFFPLYPMGVKSLKLLGKYDLVISSESGPCKGIEIPDGTPHLCYMHTPMRYCWGFTDDYVHTLPKWAQRFARSAFERLRKYDVSTIENVDRYLANSQNVQGRITRYYGKESTVVYPPIALDLFDDCNMVQRPISERNTYLSFGALTPYKNIRLLVETFNENGKPLVVIGTGSELHKLIPIARSNIRFLGQQPWSVVREHILEAKALLFPGEEDFGMVPLEVMAHGVPVLALQKGGALETVVFALGHPEQSSGMLFAEPTVASLSKAISEFESIQEQFDPQWIRAHARRFGEDHFQQSFKEQVRALMGPDFV